MSRRRLSAEDEAIEINLSPMIDCIFILLIFFIVTTVFVEEQGLQVHKPDAAAPAPLEEDEKVALAITAENEILLDGREIALVDVTGLVGSRVQGGDTPVVIRAHAKSAHGTFVNVWDATKRAGVEALSFTTVD